MSFAQLSDGTSLDCTEDVTRHMSDIVLRHPGMGNAMVLLGLSINSFTNNPSIDIVFVISGPFGRRKGTNLSGGTIAGQLNQQYGAIKDTFIVVFPPPPM